MYPKHAWYVLVALFLAGCDSPSRPIQVQTFEEKAKATLDARTKEYVAGREQILARIASALNAGNVEEARKEIGLYRQVANAELDPLAKRADIIDITAKLAKTPKDQPAERVALLSQLRVLEPSNQKWSAEHTVAYQAMKAKNEAFNRAQKIQADKERAAELKRRRSQGVSIGMSMQEVLDSSWGRPERRNKTTTARGTREQWVYHGNYLYFEDGVLTTIQN